ncbi:hypothetical protein [Clostridium algidicarnis]|uniref:Uncharacterized protein n=1 Tax=Clostridium algidicarnis DSM 15099 TaxID=1121295 RepID=A0A2S6G0I2_9CLOT|nr:hypothetical protein [Clostridium algidicarnis]PPK49437.1 hypothetical protein BD821_10197 [Clostridium algidicarnis DSM 15099]
MNLINKPISVVYEFDNAGIINPHKFIFTNEAGMENEFNIKRIIRRDKEKLGPDVYGYTFTCEIIVNEKIALCDLKVNMKTSEWILFRM